MTPPEAADEPAQPWGRDRLLALRGGLVLAVTIALAAAFLGEHYGAPVMLFALLLGMAFNFLASNDAAAPGIEFASRTLLRVGVAMLGLRMTFADVAALGWAPTAAIVGFVAATLGAGIAIARAFRRPVCFGLLSGGAVAICGASAALAIAAVLPRRQVPEQDLLITVVGVTALSTLAMIVYPALFAALGLAEPQIGFLIGATIHDVAQVVGAGYSVSEAAGDIATFTKLQRVALLPVVLIALAVAFRRETTGKVALPWFVIAFVAPLLARNVLPVPEVVLDGASAASRFLLVTAIAALGVKTSLGEIFAQGPRRMLIIAAETVFLLALALAATRIVLG